MCDSSIGLKIESSIIFMGSATELSKYIELRNILFRIENIRIEIMPNTQTLIRIKRPRLGNSILHIY